MKPFLAPCISIALLLQIASSSTAQTIPATKPAVAARGGKLAALEKKLVGTWQGPDCGGDFTFNADGTFECRHYTPGQNIFTGTWSIHWDALPPTLLLTFKTSDYKKRDPSGPEYKYVGKTLEAKLLELSKDALAFRIPDTEWSWRSLPKSEK
jgi:hypothetical protein